MHATIQPCSDVSVVIPTYNRIAMLQEALTSIFAQTFEGVVEIIVIDDNSQDETAQIIQEQYPEIHLITCSENCGPAAARNQGLAIAQGRYIAFLDSDDLWEKDYLQTQIATLTSPAHAHSAYFSVSDICLWDTRRSRRFYRPQRIHPDYPSSLHHLLAAGSFIHTPSAAVFPRQVFEQVGLFNESLRFGEDTDLYIRLIMHGYQPVFTHETLVIRRKHNQGQAIEAKNIDLRLQNRINTLKKYYPLIGEPRLGISLEEMTAQIYTQFATQCYRSQHFLKWMTLLKASTRYASWRAVLPRLKHDLGFTTRRISGFLQKWRATELV